jgi:hypothetical protein
MMPHQQIFRSFRPAQGLLPRCTGSLCQSSDDDFKSTKAGPKAVGRRRQMIVQSPTMYYSSTVKVKDIDKLHLLSVSFTQVKAERNLLSAAQFKQHSSACQLSGIS